MAEIDDPSSPVDWSYADRIGFTRRWNYANCLNLYMAAPDQYKKIAQRAAFYDWFDQIRERQGHEILWPAAAWVVAMQMSNVDKFPQDIIISDKVIEFAHAGNKTIFDDVVPRLKDVYMQGLRGNPITGADAQQWDAATLHHEQFDVVQPLYERYARTDMGVRTQLQHMASGSGIYAMGGVAIGFRLDFVGDIMDPQDRYNHGMNKVVAFYNQFKQAIDSSRRREEQFQPDPNAGGLIQYRGASAPPPP
jgi:hypothetical protein